jgi:alcohol dehydrogenase
MNDFLSSFLCPTRIHMGRNAHEKLEEALRGFGAERVFVVADAAVADGELMQRVRAILARNGAATGTFTEVEPDPSAHTVERAFDACRALDAQLVLAVGGGSTMDVAKAVAILATNGGRIHDYEGIEKFSTRPLPRIAIPTTAGTGSEVSGSCVITDTERGLKMSIRHAALNPADVALLDPLAVATLPAHVAAHAGMDAFVHAFESYLSLNANPITDALNLHALALLSANLRPFTANRRNADAALAMLCGSTLAGMTFGITGLGNVHCMARFVGAYFHVSHGLSNAICLPHVARFNLAANPARYARVAAALGCHVDGLPVLAAAAETIAAIDALCDDLDIPARLSDIGATPEHYPEMARLCVAAGYNRWNPRHTEYADFLKLFEEAH